jgi:hypothetical protein
MALGGDAADQSGGAPRRSDTSAPVDVVSG